MKNTIICTLTLCLLCLNRVSVFADTYTSAGFQKNSEAEKTWWYMGAVYTLGLYISQTDKAKANCIWSWYDTNRLARNKQLKAAMLQYPNHSPAAMLVAVLMKDCGKF